MCQTLCSAALPSSPPVCFPAERSAMCCSTVYRAAPGPPGPKEGGAVTAEDVQQVCGPLRASRRLLRPLRVAADHPASPPAGPRPPGALHTAGHEQGRGCSTAGAARGGTQVHPFRCTATPAVSRRPARAPLSTSFWPPITPRRSPDPPCCSLGAPGGGEPRVLCSLLPPALGNGECAARASYPQPPPPPAGRASFPFHRASHLIVAPQPPPPLQAELARCQM